MKMGIVFSMSIAWLAAECCLAGTEGAAARKGIDSVVDIEALPFLKTEARMHFTGSMAKNGGNPDWQWCLYQDQANPASTNQEWVIFDETGPGCIQHFYNHHNQPGNNWYTPGRKPYQGPDAVYRFYFDGAKTPQFSIKASEFGTLAGFEAPLTDQYFNWVKRTWFPMYFRKGCKVTTSEPLGFPPLETCGCGGIVWHSFADTNGVPDFAHTLAIRGRVSKMLSGPYGKDPKPTDGNLERKALAVAVPGDVTVLLNESGEASIASVVMEMKPYHPDYINKLRVLMWFDDYSKPAVDAVFGGFFGNHIGRTTTQMLLQGLDVGHGGEKYAYVPGDASKQPKFESLFRQDKREVKYSFARGYSYFPMPFWKRARIAVAAAEDFPPGVQISLTASIRPSAKKAYPKGRCGYFHAVCRPAYTPAMNDDVEYAVLRGTGQMVQGAFSSWSSCESDYHFYADNSATPFLESDGAESWAGFGAGFIGPYSFAVTCEDGEATKRNEYRADSLLSCQNLYYCRWNETRTLLGDFYPFSGMLVARQENAMRVLPRFHWTFMPPRDADYQGVVLYYGVDKRTLACTDEMDVGDKDSEGKHDYRAENAVAVSLTSRYEGCDFSKGFNNTNTNSDDSMGQFLTPNHEGSSNRYEVTTGGWIAGEVTDIGKAVKGFSEFTVKILPDNVGVMLRRRSDQKFGRQRARVFIDGRRVMERDWYHADRNWVLRWLDDEFEIPVSYTKGKSKLRVRLEFVPVIDLKPQPFATDLPATAWSEYKYTVFTRLAL